VGVDKPPSAALLLEHFLDVRTEYACVVFSGAPGIWGFLNAQRHSSVGADLLP
jgi:hypothetical protein